MAPHRKYGFVALFPLSQLCERCPKAEYLKYLETEIFSQTLAITQQILTFPLLMMCSAFIRGMVTIAICMPPYMGRIALTFRASTGTPEVSASAF